MAELLADSEIRTTGLQKGIKSVFQAFDKSRRPRTQWLVRSSRRSGDLYEWRAEGVGDNIEKIAQECRESNKIIWDAQISNMVNEAKEELYRILRDDH